MLLLEGGKMRVYLTPAFNINSAITSQDVISAYITQKLDNGYIVNIGGTEVFAHCLLDFDTGDFLKLKVVESSKSQVVFKVVEHQREELQDLSKSLPTPNVLNSKEAQIPLNLLSKLNLPIMEERMELIMELLNQLTNEERLDPSLPPSKELPLHEIFSVFREAITQDPKTDVVFQEKKLLGLLKNFTAKEGKKATAEDIKEQLALNAINLLHREDSANNIYFFALPIAIYHKIYLRVTSHHSAKDAESSYSLSFIINTKNLGAILVNLYYVHGKITASSVFEDKKALDTVKKFLKESKDIPQIVRTMELKIGKVSKKDFFFSNIKKRPINLGINIKV